MALIPFYRKTRKTQGYGLAAARPAATDVLPGTLYFSSDTFALERSNGTTWDSYMPPIGGNTWINAAFNAGDYTSDVSTWTVALADVTASRYTTIGKTMIWEIAIAATSTVGGGPAVTFLFIKIPAGITCPGVNGSFAVRHAYTYNNGGPQVDYLTTVYDSTHIVIHHGGSQIFPGQMAAYFTIVFERN